MNSQYIVNFLLRTGLLKVEAGRCRVGVWARRWLDNDDPGIVIALVNSRVRFIVEMLEELRTAPRSSHELLSIANDKYNFNWKTDGSIASRRGWLESAGFIETTYGKRLAITEAGRNFLIRLRVPPPLPRPVTTPEPVPGPPAGPDPVPDPQPEPAPRPEPVQDQPGVNDLATKLRESARDSQNPRRFEQAVRDAFDYLGFRADLLGGSGKTDVLLTARLGRSDSYKVTVDAKTTASGHLADMQVDWATLVEHQKNEGADYSLLVGPDPRGARLFNRAADHGVTVLAAHQLAELCLSHAGAPLGLADYRLIFTTHGEANLTEMNDRAQDSERLRLLAAEIFRTLAGRWATVGYHTARDLWMLLPHANEGMIQSVLDTLANPLVGAIQGDREKGYVLATDPKVTQRRLALLGKELTGTKPAP